MERKKTPSKKPKRVTRKKIDKHANIEKALASLETAERPFNPKLFCSIAEEFLHSFIIMGYTQTGEPVTITSAKDQQQMDALHTSLQRFIAMFMGGGPMPGMDPELPEESNDEE